MTFRLDDTLAKIINLDLQNPNIVPFLAGEPAIGKTSFVKGLAERFGYAVFAISINTMADKGDLTGARTLQDPKDGQWKQMFFPHETIMAANTYAEEHPDETVILLLDEINRADSDVTSATMTLSTERKAGTTLLKDNVRIMTTGNLSGNVTTLDSASLTRFALYEVTPSADTFISIMGDALDPRIKTLLTHNPEYIFLKPDANVDVAESDEDSDDGSVALTFETEFGVDQDMVQYTAPRTLEGLSHWLRAADKEFLQELLVTQITDEAGRKRSALQHVLESHTGATAFTFELAALLVEELAAPATPVQPLTQVSPERPDCYSDLLQLRSRSELESELLAMDKSTRGEVFLYALHDDTNRQATELLQILTTRGVLDSLDRPQLQRLVAYGAAPADNLRVLSATSSPLTQALAGFMGLLGLDS